MSGYSCRSVRATVFLDYQNLYHRAREAFFGPGCSSIEGQVDPLALGRLLAERVPGRVLTGVRVYRGRPSPRRDPRSYSANVRQATTWSGRGEGLVTVVTRSLRYPLGWPGTPAQEKGVDVALAVDFVMMAARGDYDVGILVSTDTDLVPALEAVLALQHCGAPACEVAAWAPSGRRPRPLAVKGARIHFHCLSQQEYLAVADPFDYAHGR